MRLGAQADVFKVILSAIATFALAAAISPYFFEVGKGFAFFVVGRDTAEGMVWLGEEAERADFETYFKRALVISAILCLIPLFFSLRLRQENQTKETGQPLQKSPRGLLHALAGFLIASAFFTMAWHESQQWHSLPKTFLQALALSILVVVFFQGALLGIFLRAFRPGIAIIGISLLFATVHFLTPPADAAITNPRASDAGFELLSLALQKFLQPKYLLTNFVPLFFAGLILALTRHRTASLWLPIGLHAGWIFSSKLAGHTFHTGANIIEGIFSLGIFLLTALALHFYLKATHPKALA